MVTDVPAVVGVCTLGSTELAVRLRAAPGVAVAAPLRTANLGVEELVRSVLNHPSIRVLLVCGPDSRLFRQGQSLVALVRSGVAGPRQRIVGAVGYRPQLPGLRSSDVDSFRRRVRLVDLREVTDPAVLEPRIAEVAAGCGARTPDVAPIAGPRFRRLRPGGRRRPIASAGEGFFVVSLDRGRRDVVLRHYRDDFTAGHEIRGRRAESVLLGVVGAGLVRDPGHAGYLGAELAKAETALRLELDYCQDIPLRRPTGEESRMPGTGSLEEFTRRIGALLGADGPELHPDRPLGEQVGVDSVRLIELAIVLEQEYGLDLADDVDLRRTTPAELHRCASGRRPVQ